MKNHWRWNRQVFFCLFFVFARLLTAQSNEWKTYKSAGGNFSVLFPGDPKDVVNGDSKDADSHTLSVKDGPYSYAVIYARLKTDQPVDEPTFAKFKEGFFRSLPNCDISKEQPPAPSIQGYVGREYRLSCDTASVIVLGNLYWGKRGGYAVVVAYRSSSPDPPALTKFLDSFSPLPEQP